MNRSFSLPIASGHLFGDVAIPLAPDGLILLARAHRNLDDRAYAAECNAIGKSVMAVDLLDHHELQFPEATQNVPRLTERLIAVFEWIRRDGDLQSLPLGIIAAAELVPAAIRAAARRDAQVKTLACCAGQPDRAGRGALELLSADLGFFIPDDDTAAQRAVERCRPYLRVEFEQNLVKSETDGWQAAMRWVSAQLQQK